MEKSKLFLRILFILLAFSLGFIANELYSIYGDILFFSPEFGGVIEKTPQDILTREDIFIYNDRIVVYINNSGLSSYDSSGSMNPVLDENSNGITIKPESEEDVEIGDIISYNKGEHIIVHRVLGKGADEEGIYFITKGDNSDLIDDKVRFFQIEKKIVGILY